MSVADGGSGIPPGWYPDPADAARLRRWDGQQWTQEVILAPDEEPAAPAAPPAPEPAPVQPIIQQPIDVPPLQQPADVPPVGQPVPASPAPTIPPPGQPPGPAPETPVPASPAEPVMQPTVPHPSPPISHPRTNTQSGPVSLPDWANLPGLTLPPDLSSLPGMESDSILNRPTFEEPERRELPTMPAFEPPFIPQRPDVQDVGRAQPTAPASRPAAPPAPATPYAPPPSGAQYDVPPPPGVAHAPSSGPVLPRSAFVAPQPVPQARSPLPPVGVIAPTAIPPAAAAQNGFSRGPLAVDSITTNTVTISSWLIAALPLLQFGAIYLVFKVLDVALAPGMQWGVLAIPAAFSLLFANADRKKLASVDATAPSIVFALIPPLYLLVRCFTTGRSSVLPLVVWVLLQAGAAAGVYYLLPSLLAAGISAIG